MFVCLAKQYPKSNSIQLWSNLDIEGPYTPKNFGTISKLFKKLRFGKEALFNPTTLDNLHDVQ